MLTVVLQLIHRVSVPSSAVAFPFAVVDFAFVGLAGAVLDPSETRVEFFLETGAESGLTLPSAVRSDELSVFGPRNAAE